jgi:hypothetical protein
MQPQHLDAFAQYVGAVLTALRAGHGEDPFLSPAEGALVRTNFLGGISAGPCLQFLLVRRGSLRAGDLFQPAPSSAPPVRPRFVRELVAGHYRRTEPPVISLK